MTTPSSERSTPDRNRPDRNRLDDRSRLDRNRLDRKTWSLRFIRSLLLWIFPAAFVWMAVTPYYNLFLNTSTENLVRLSESPAATRLQLHEDLHHFLITRTDVPTSRGSLGSVRISDTHFPLIMLWAFFLAVPAIPWRKRFENLGWATLASIFFHILSLFCWVKFIYATQLGEWSVQNFSTFQINFWGLSKHLLDLPFKFSMPLILWAAFYLGEMLPRDSAPANTN